jgi:hypothetical protein
MRWDFTIEDHTWKRFDESDFEKFRLECRTFLENAINSRQWFIWDARFITLTFPLARSQRLLCSFHNTHFPASSSEMPTMNDSYYFKKKENQ